MMTLALVRHLQSANKTLKSNQHIPVAGAMRLERQINIL